MVTMSLKGQERTHNAEFELRQVDGGDVDVFVNGNLLGWFETTSAGIRFYRAVGQSYELFVIEEGSQGKILCT